MSDSKVALKQSIRAQFITKRTYCRPVYNEQGEQIRLETWPEVVNRVIEHQKWLWIRAKYGTTLNEEQTAELEELRELMLGGYAVLSGRTLWLGGTEVAKTRESSMFNCSGTKVETVYDIVDVFWLLLQGCGVGFKPVRGTLNGFFKPIKHIEVIRSTKVLGERGSEENYEKVSLREKTWTIKIGDSAEAWAKSIGKLLAGKYKVDKLILDFSEIRAAGERLKGYGWVSSGDEAISKAYVKIAELLSKRAGSLLSAIDILDIINHLGTVLSSRRSAEIAVFDVDDYEAEAFAVAKKGYFICKSCGSWNTKNGICKDCGEENTNIHRGQSNNSLLFHRKPTKERLEHIFNLMQDAGGSEPGFINAEAASKRAPWFSVPNPCAEILLPNKGFCNLSTIFLHRFKGETEKLNRALYIFARANYRQTLVNLKDGILQEAWHLNNEFLRLCGVNLTGIVMRDDLIPYDYRNMERLVTSAAYSMADELSLQRPKNVTTIQPSGTLSKCFDSTEGLHKPLGKYIINNVIFSKHDENLPLLHEAGYRIFDHYSDSESVVVSFPVEWEDLGFTEVNGTPVNLESAIVQLERYKLLQTNWTQQNSSVTISYSPDEIPAILDWIWANWDIYVGVSFMYREDPTTSAADSGHPYLPQEVVSKEKFFEYVSTLKEVKIIDSNEEIEEQGCVNGVCPTR